VGRKMKNPKSEILFAFYCVTLLILIYLASPYVAASVHVQTVDLPPPTPTSISCSVIPTSVILGNYTTVSGSISPPVPNVPVTLTYTKPDATTSDRTVMTEADGAFNDTYAPSMAGSWSVKAIWEGNDNYLGSTSFDAKFTVEEPSASSIPTQYIVVVVIAIVVIAAIAIYWNRKKK
jgi:hypothetical protein